MTHPLRTVSYVADIEGSLVVMAHRSIPSSPGQQLKLTCHVLDTEDVSTWRNTACLFSFSLFLSLGLLQW